MIVGDMEIRLRADLARLQRDMDDARRIAGSAMDRIGRAAGVVKNALGMIAGALSVAAFAVWIKGAIDAADAASKLSAKTGVAVKDIAGMELSFKLGGVGGDAMASSMARLSKGMVEGNKGLEQLGIKTKNVDGSFKSTRDVLWEVADRFQGMDSGARKTSLAMEIFGKTGAELIPMLNGGSEAMREMDEMAQKLGLSISEEAAANSEKFNDTLDLLALGSQGVARGVAAELLPTLNSLAGSFLTSMTQGDKLAKTAQFLGTGFKLLYSVGVGVAEVFNTVGTVIGGLMAYISNVLGTYANVIGKIIDRDWKGAYAAIGNGVKNSGEIIKGVGDDVGASWLDTGNTIRTAWDGSGNAAVETMSKVAKMKTVIGLDSQAQAKAEADRKKKADDAEKERMKALEDGYKKQKDWMANLAAVENLKYGAVDQEIADAKKEADANEALIATFGMSKVAIEEQALARAEAQLAQANSIGLTEEETARLTELVEAKRRNVAAVGKLEGMQENTDVTRAKDLLDIMAQVDEVTKSAASNMASSFGRVGSAIGSLTTALSGYGRAQAAVAAQLAAATKDAGGDTTKIQKANAVAAQQSAQAQVRSYGDMAGAAKGFFKENSRGYKAMEDVEKAYRAMEMAMAIKSMVTKLFATTTTTAAAVGGTEAEIIADKIKMLNAETNTAEIIALAMAEGEAKAISGVAGQASGDPYTAFPRMAAMAAAMAALGFAVAGGMKGGGGGMSAEDVQKVQGTGGVFGDAKAKSNSIANSIALLAENSGTLIPINLGMLNALRAIEASMSGLTNLIVRVPGLTEGTNLGIQTGQLNAYGTPTDDFSKFMTNIVKLDPLMSGMSGKAASFMNNLWGKVKANIVDSGLEFGGSVRNLQDGKGFNQYASVDTTKSSVFGLRKKTSNRVETAGLDAGLSSQFGLVFKDVEVALGEAAKAMGGKVEDVTSVLDKMTISLTTISLKGLTGEALTAEISAVLSKAMDQMSSAVFPALDGFRKVGEGYTETVMRLAGNYGRLDASLESIGMTFGARGLASLKARVDIILLVGGIEKATESAASFAENYLTEAERLAPVQRHVIEQLEAMGLASIDTREEFKNYVLSLDLSKAKQQEQYAALMLLESAFAKTHAATKDLTKSEQAIADERAELQDRLDELTKTSAELRAKERATLAESNRSLFDQVHAREDLAEAYDRESNAVKSLVDSMKSAQSSTLAYRDSLALGSLSTLTPLQKAAEAQRQYEASLDKVHSNPLDSQAYSASQAAASAFLSASQIINASGDAQVAAVRKVENDMAILAQLAGTQMSDTQLQLAMMDKQYGQLVALNQSVLSFKDALVNVSKADAAALATSGIPQIDFSAMGTSGMAPLVAEIKGLRASNEALAVEVAALRADQVQHTAALLESNAKVTTAAADKVVEGNRGTYRDEVWTSRTTREVLV